MPLSYNNNTPQSSQTVASTQAPILTNFQSIDSAFNSPVGGVTGGGNFTSYSFQATTTSFTAKPVNPIGVLSTVASSGGNPELAWINNVNSTGAGPFNGTQLTGGGVTAAAWVTFNAAGTIPAGGSYNISSVTLGGGNVYTVNFTRNFASTAYVAVSSFDISSVGGTNVTGLDQQSRNVASYVYRVRNSVGGFIAPTNTYIVFFGMLV